jgi:Flp pilus assembly protein TadB
MLKANGKITIRWPAKHRDATDLQEESVHVFPVSRWISYLILIPLSLAAVVLTAFFFSAFLALFLIAGIVLGVWIWWLRRKLRKSARSEGLGGEYVVIKETHIVETKADKVGDE